MTAPRTVGEAVDQYGVCEAMVKILDIALALHRVPVGEWDYTFTTDPRWRVCLNGGPHKEWHVETALRVPRFNAFVLFNGWPAGLLDAAGGTVVNDMEADLIAACEKEVAALT